MSRHQIEAYNFEFWRGEQPQFPQQNVASFVRAGADGTTQQLLGKWYKQFTAELESHWENYAAAMAILPDYIDQVGTGFKSVTYNLLDMRATYELQFTVENVEFIDCQAAVYLQGENYLFPGGARLVTRWTMTPHFSPAPE